MAAQTLVALVGLGRMGTALCERLTGSGLAVRGYDIRADARRAAEVVGARSAGSLAEAAAGARYVLTCLPGDAEVDALTGELLEAMTPGAVWIEMSTASPAVASRREAAAAAAGVVALDAPVGGDPAAARAGRLLCFVGAGAEAIEAARPVLQVVADRVVHVGPPGAGYLLKLLANTIWFTQAVVTSEALTLAVRSGLDPDVARAALAQSPASGRFLTEDAAAFLRGDNRDSFSLERCCDQLAAVVGQGARLAVELTLTSAVEDLHREALAHYGRADGELLGARWVADRAGVEFG